MIRRLWLSLCLLLAFAAAQSTATNPEFTLSDTRIEVGETVTLTGSGLRPNAPLTLRVVGPNDTTEESEFQADEEGVFRFDISAEESGVWEIELSSNNNSELAESFRFVVVEASQEAGTESATAATEPAGDSETSTEPEAAAQDNEQDTAATAPATTSSSEESSEAASTEDASNISSGDEALSPESEQEGVETTPTPTNETVAEETPSDTNAETEGQGDGAVPEETAEDASSERETTPSASPAETSATEETKDTAQTTPEAPLTSEAEQETTASEQPDEAATDQTDLTESEADADESQNEAAREDTAADTPTETEEDTGQATPGTTDDQETASQDAASQDEATEAQEAGSDLPPEEAPADTGESATESPVDEAETEGGNEEDAAVEETPATGTVQLELEDDTVIVKRGERELWQLSFPDGSGATGATLKQDDNVYIGHGNSVLRLDLAEGKVEERWIVSGQVTGLEPDGDAIMITVTHQNGLKEQFTLTGGEIQEAVRFGNNPDIFSWLEAEAQVEDPAARLQRDPTNPWLYLALPVNELAENPEAAADTFQQALEAAQTFYDHAGIAQVLLAAGQRDLAAEAFDAAMADFAERGYNPQLLGNPELARAYNFPLEVLERSLEAGDLDRAAFWAERLALSAPQLEQTQQLLNRYADALEAEGLDSEAARWRAAARDGGITGSGLEQLLSTLGRSGWAYALALVIAIVALHLTLLTKYWRPQSEMMSQRRASGQNVSPLYRLLAMRFYSFTEKLVLVLMFAATLTLVGLATWSDRGGEPIEALGSGTLANAAARQALGSESLSGGRAGFIRGYAAQVAGEADAARDFYREAEGYGPTVNNLGVLESDQTLFEKALELSPGLPEARYNLGEQSGGFPFQQRYKAGENVLAVPTEGDFQVALAGTWRDALQTTFTEPWTLWTAAPAGLNTVIWTVIWLLFLLVTVITVLWLFIPRPGLARNAPRTPLYHLLALLIPGSGLADEVWGLLLIIPWAVIGLDTLSKFFGWGVNLGLSLRWDYLLLGAIYVVNLIALVVEFSSYRQRMKERRKRIATVKA